MLIDDGDDDNDDDDDADDADDDDDGHRSGVLSPWYHYSTASSLYCTNASGTGRSNIRDNSKGQYSSVIHNAPRHHY